LLSTFLDCKNIEEILNNRYENALLIVTKAIDKFMIGGDDVTIDVAQSGENVNWLVKI
jgi:hypothetical protein